MKVVGMQKLNIAVITLNGTFPEALDNKLTDENEKDVKTSDKKYFVTFRPIYLIAFSCNLENYIFNLNFA